MPKESEDDFLLTEEEILQKRKSKKERQDKKQKRERKRLKKTQENMERKSFRMMQPATTQAPAILGEGRRLRSDISSDLGRDLAELRANDINSDDGRFLGRQSTSSSITPSARETFNCVCTNCPGEASTCTSDYMCTALTFKDESGEYTTYSCLNHSENFMQLAYCEGGREGKSTQNTIRTICCSGDMCNDVPAPRLPSTDITIIQSQTEGVSYIHPAVFLVVPSVLCILLLLLTILFIYKRFTSSQEKRKEKKRVRNDLGDNLSAQPLTDDCSIELPDPTSGSGSGMPMLVQRTIAKSVTLLDQIGTGKYGKVYKGLYQSSPVAVKIFLSKDVNSWAWENEIYTTLLLRHENILGFIASDMISSDSVTQFWLICHYHKDGSLYDFLNEPYNVITPSQCLLMLYSAASGLVHLHTEIFGTQAKPAIAHRDIKSKNILVKEDGSCCIADLGLSMMHKSQENVLQSSSTNTMVGTKRYMAPELLDETMNHDDFEAYKRADIYSFSLVIWETAQCAIKDGQAEKYQMPYGGVVPNDPTFEEMRQVVVAQKKRPPIPCHWNNDKIFRSISKLIKECWSNSPTARLSILRVKKNLNSLLIESRDCKEFV
ncbi:activin receptor type-1-like [Watersipora subatra]|uniref:activin receptor type-1-like n=1 Tax=Watersipora subatra TaxID=2589382 RepID=UPI00355C10AB